MPHSAGRRSPPRALHERHDATTLSQECVPRRDRRHDVVEVLGRAPAILATVVVHREHGPA